MDLNITWQNGSIDKSEKRKILNQTGIVIWFTGLSASGKSTIAIELEKKLLEEGILSYRLDGDNLRFGLNKDLGFSIQDREENIRRTAEVAKILKENRIVVLASFITPTETLRKLAREIVKENFVEVYVKTSLEECIKRDPKGLYKKAMNNEIENFTGISAEFEKPKNPELILDTEKVSINRSAQSLVDVVKNYQSTYQQGIKNHNEVLGILKKVSIDAGKAIMEIYENKDFSIEYKKDKSPLTLADKKSNEIIVKAIREKFDCDIYGILTEEEKDDLTRLKKEWCFIIDPLDGTREFIKRNGEFTVNIALTYKGKSVVGVIYVPATKDLYYASKGYGAYLIRNGECTRLSVSDKKEDICLVKSSSHNDEKMDKFIKDNNINNIISVGSSLKGCMVAEGKAEVYYRFGHTMEWDTAAMQCIAEESGAIFKQMDNEEMSYNRVNSLNDKGFYIVNCKENIFYNRLVP